MTVPQIYTVVALCIYTALMIFIGCISYGKSKNLDSFLIGGRNIGAWATAFAYGTTYFSAVVFVGYAGQHGWNIGIGAIWIGVGNAVLGCLLSWLLFANRTRKMTKKLNARTMPDYFEKRYNSKGMKILAAVIILLGGFLVWCSVGVLETKAKAEIVVEDRIAVCAVSGNKASQVKEGMILELEGNEYEVETVKIDTYGQAVASAEVSVADGTYEGAIVIERVTPISFLFH